VAQYSFETLYGIQVTELRITAHPIVATLVFRHQDVVYEFRCENPQGIGMFAEILQECYQIRVVDLNSNNANLEYGRFRIELWGEDNALADVIADRYKQLAVDAVN
jgi:hypothetical protein